MGYKEQLACDKQGIVLLSEKGQTGSNIHLYNFGDEGDKITVKIRHNDKEATLTFTVVPEFMNGYALLISLLTMLILISIFGSNLIRRY